MRGVALEQVAVRSSPQRLEHRLSVAAHGEDEYLGGRPNCRSLLHDRQGVQLWQSQIQDGDIRREPPDHLDGASAVAAVSDDAELSRALADSRQAFPEQRLFVSQEDGSLLRHRHSQGAAASLQPAESRHAK